VQDKEI